MTTGSTRHNMINTASVATAAAAPTDGELSLRSAELELVAARTESRPDSNPVTGADLGAGPGAGKTTNTSGTKKKR